MPEMVDKVVEAVVDPPQELLEPQVLMDYSLVVMALFQRQVVITEDMELLAPEVAVVAEEACQCA